jgi:hypothetical protein
MGWQDQKNATNETGARTPHRDLEMTAKLRLFRPEQCGHLLVEHLRVIRRIMASMTILTSIFDDIVDRASK